MLTAREYADLRQCGLDSARKEIGILKASGKVQSGVRKPLRKLDDTVQMVSAYRFFVV